MHTQIYVIITTENKRCRLRGIRYAVLSVQYITILLLAHAKLRQVSDIC